MGATGTRIAELVFNTATTGYQEILTDPSYAGQIVLMTSPEMGNYGVNVDDVESHGGRVYARGLVVRRLSKLPSSWRAEQPLDAYLKHHQLTGIEGIDTRAVTRKIRELGSMKAAITTENTPVEAVLEAINAHPGLEEQDLVNEVTTPEPYQLAGSKNVKFENFKLKTLAVIDLGIKQNILRQLQELVWTIYVFPAHAKKEDILACKPDAVFLSNGPGDPSILTDTIQLAKDLIGSGLPTFGICLGHQILALASGAKVEKMRFGHHGANHPVKDLETGRIVITSQNHGYAVCEDGVSEDMVVTHVNLNDGSIEGFRHKAAPVFSVQFHPEASPGPHDAQYLFERFIEAIAPVKA